MPTHPPATQAAHGRHLARRLQHRCRRDQDEAVHWFTEKLGFRQHTDLPETDMRGRPMPGPGMRFLTISAPEQPDLQIILASWFPDKNWHKCHRGAVHR
jgi:hypothetical protein